MPGLPAIYHDGVIDVSHHNGTIDWRQVYAAGITFAFLKATQGTDYVDPTFRYNRIAALNAGIMVAPYHFLDASDGGRQARHFLAVSGAGKGAPVMLDWEQDGVGKSVLIAMGDQLASVTGRPPITYYGYSWVTVPDERLSAWPLMLPGYPKGNVPGDYRALVSRMPRLPAGRDPQRPYDFHQYTPAGHVPGIKGPVDRSIWVGTVAELRSFALVGKAPEPVAPPAIALPTHDLMLHSQGPEVAALQALLAAAGFALNADGDFGPQTRTAVKAFQQAHGLDPDGIVGPQTRAALAA